MEKIAGKYRLFLFIVIPLTSLLMHFHVLNMDLVGIHVWRQTQTQTNIQNFYEEDNNILTPRVNWRSDSNTDGVFRMEFPLMQWLFAQVYKVFGDHIIISRLLSFIIGMFTVWGMFFLLLFIFKERGTALLGAWAFNFSPVFYYYTVNPLPDNLALCAGVWSMTFFFRWLNEQKILHIILSAACLSVAALVKLPFILFGIVPAAYILRNMFNRAHSIGKIVSSTGIYILLGIPAAAWYLWVIPGWTGNGVVRGILDQSKDQWRKVLDDLIGNVVSTLPELLINYAACLFFVWGIYSTVKNKLYRKRSFYLFALWGIAITAYFLYELNMIGTVHDYYMFPVLPLLFILVTYGISQLLKSSRPARIFAFILLLALPLTAFIRIDTRWDTQSPGFNSDLLKYRQELRDAVPDTSLCVAGNDNSQYIFFYYLHKKGWAFNSDSLRADQLRSMISKGARYMYSDSRIVNEDTSISKLIDKEITRKGSISVFSLKEND